MRVRTVRIFTGALAAALLLSACGSGDDDADQASEPTPGPSASPAAIAEATPSPEASMEPTPTAAATDDSGNELTEAFYFESRDSDGDEYAGSLSVGAPFKLAGSPVQGQASQRCPVDTSRAIGVPFEVTVSLKSQLPYEIGLNFTPSGRLPNTLILDNDSCTVLIEGTHTGVGNEHLRFGRLEWGQSRTLRGYVIGTDLVSPDHPDGDQEAMARWMLGTAAFGDLTRLEGPRVTRCESAYVRYMWHVAAPATPQTFESINDVECKPDSIVPGTSSGTGAADGE